MDGTLKCIAYTEASNFPVPGDLRTCSVEGSRKVQNSKISHPQAPIWICQHVVWGGAEGEGTRVLPRCKGQKGISRAIAHVTEACLLGSRLPSEKEGKETYSPLQSPSSCGTSSQARRERRHGNYSRQVCSCVPENSGCGWRLAVMWVLIDRSKKFRGGQRKEKRGSGQ